MSALQPDPAARHRSVRVVHTEPKMGTRSLEWDITEPGDAPPDAHPAQESSALQESMVNPEKSSSLIGSSPFA